MAVGRSAFEAGLLGHVMIDFVTLLDPPPVTAAPSSTAVPGGLRLWLVDLRPGITPSLMAFQLFDFLAGASHKCDGRTPCTAPTCSPHRACPAGSRARRPSRHHGSMPAPPVPPLPNPALASTAYCTTFPSFPSPTHLRLLTAPATPPPPAAGSFDPLAGTYSVELGPVDEPSSSRAEPSGQLAAGPSGRPSTQETGQVGWSCGRAASHPLLDGPARGSRVTCDRFRSMGRPPSRCPRVGVLVLFSRGVIPYCNLHRLCATSLRWTGCSTPRSRPCPARASSSRAGRTGCTSTSTRDRRAPSGHVACGQTPHRGRFTPPLSLKQA
jgi:hypothetical protein